MPISFENLKESLINQINNPENFNGKFIYFMSSPGIEDGLAKDEKQNEE